VKQMQECRSGAGIAGKSSTQGASSERETMMVTLGNRKGAGAGESKDETSRRAAAPFNDGV